MVCSLKGHVCSPKKKNKVVANYVFEDIQFERSYHLGSSLGTLFILSYMYQNIFPPFIDLIIKLLRRDCLRKLQFTSQFS